MLLELVLKPEDIKDKTLFYGRGCEFCNNTGYRGRMGLYEIMIIDDNLRRMIMDNASTAELRAAAKKNGTRSLREAGLLAIYDGVTTIEEVAKETLFDDA